MKDLRDLKDLTIHDVKPMMWTGWTTRCSRASTTQSRGASRPSAGNPRPFRPRGGNPRPLKFALGRSSGEEAQRGVREG